MYTLSIRTADMKPAWITSADILAMLDASNASHQRHIARIEQIERDGIRYSYEDYDVLSAAYRAS